MVASAAVRHGRATATLVEIDSAVTVAWPQCERRDIHEAQRLPPHAGARS
jgi:hypothetical protein